MPTYFDGYTGSDSYEHKYYVRLRNSGFDCEDANMFARVAVESDRNKDLATMIRQRGIVGLLDYARSHWPSLCNWIESAWDRIKIFFGF